MRVSQRSIEEVRESSNIAEIASEFTALRRQGTRYSGLCPYPDHSEKTPSFSVSPDKGFYYCFGCGKGGDAIKLVSDLKDLPFIEAISYLAERSNIELEFEGSSDTDARAAKEKNQRRRAIHRALAAATAYYHKYLLKSQSPEAEAARAYLKNRDIQDSTIEEFRLGLAPPRSSGRFVEIACGLDMGREVLDAAGLISPRGGERFAGRITFPISDRRGRVVGFGARSLGDVQPKYLNSPETEIFNKRDLLYGFPQVMDAMRKERSALVVEGYTDVLMLYQSGMANAVATLGTAATPGHLKVLSRYVDKVYVLFDPDAAGNRAAERMVTTDSIASVAAELQLDLRLLQLTEDPADWLRKHNAEEFDVLLEGAVPVLEFAIRNIAEKHHGADAMSRSRAVPEIKKLIQRIDDSVLRREALRLATQTLDVGPEVFSQPSSRSSNGHPQDTLSHTEDPHVRAGREMLALILSRPDLFKRLLSEGVPVENLPEPVTLSTENFPVESQSRLFEILSEDPDKDPGAKISEAYDGALLDELGLLYTMGEKLYPSQTSVQSACLRLNILSRERDKRRAEDYEAKSGIQSEIQLLKEALKTAVEQS